MKHHAFSRLLTAAVIVAFLVLVAHSTVAQQRRASRQTPAQTPIQTPAQQSELPSQQQMAGNVRASRPPAASKPASLDRIAAQLKVTGPHAHANLTIYCIEGDDRADTTKVLTLSEALSKKGTVLIKETGDVNELSVQNKSKPHTVFLMAGDIVKGGKQDRTLGTDLPLMTKAGEVPVSAFCVEQGRWRPRGGEAVTHFAEAAKTVATKDGKIAVRKAKQQDEVWDTVKKAQAKLSENVGRSVAAPASPTSLQLALENPDLKKKNDAFIKALADVIDKNERAIGYVAVINGHINSAEIFAGHDLFRRAWPKLLEAAATEAVAEEKEKPAAAAVTTEKAADFLAAAEDTKATAEQIHGSYWNVSGENDTTLIFQTVDESAGGRWLRRSIIKK